MKQTLKRFLAWMLVLCMVLGFLPAARASDVTWEKTDQKITAPVSDRLVRKDESADRDPGEPVRVSIVLDKPSALEAGFSTMSIAADRKAMAYRAELQAQQTAMPMHLPGRQGRGSLVCPWQMPM